MHVNFVWRDQPDSLTERHSYLLDQVVGCDLLTVISRAVPIVITYSRSVTSLLPYMEAREENI